VEETDQTTNFTYDANGNRETKEIIGGSTTNYNYNTENQLTSITGVYNYEYDECGNLIKLKDPRGQIV
jgi:YD repeat-containing protein